ncbi:branched-chain amino acid ABC transporter permease [Actinomadura nitritigenes]|uniref:branched-chain amino acid ABC transporter permease n=1 Tax=Actinomadura nitritigenes TaxID=134602 RepID=UPI003D9251BC
MTLAHAMDRPALRRIRDHGSTRWIVLAAFFAVAWFALGGLESATLTVMVLVLYYAAAGTSFNLLFGSLGVFSLAQPVFVMVGGYTSAYLFARHQISPWISMLVATVVAGALALPIGFIAMRRSGTIVTALVTLILSQAAPPIISAVKPLGGTIGLYIPVKSGDNWWDMQFATGVPFARILLVINVVFIAGLMWFARSKWGGWTTAIRDSEAAARATGIPVLRVRITMFVVSAMMASLPGVVYAQYNLLSNTELFLSMSALFQVLVVALVGGVDRAWGTLVGAVLMVEISHRLSEAAGGRPGIGPLTFAGAFLIMALVLPRGISGAWAAFQARFPGKDSDGATDGAGGNTAGPANESVVDDRPSAAATTEGARRGSD